MFIVNLTRFRTTQEAYHSTVLWGCFQRHLVEEGKCGINVADIIPRAGALAQIQRKRGYSEGNINVHFSPLSGYRCSVTHIWSTPPGATLATVVSLPWWAIPSNCELKTRPSSLKVDHRGHFVTVITINKLLVGLEIK